MAYFDYENIKFYFILTFSMILIVSNYILAGIFLTGYLLLAILKIKIEKNTKKELPFIALLYIFLIIQISFEIGI